LVAVQWAGFWADVVVLRCPDRAAAYRVLIGPHDDPLQATSVLWHYLSDAERTLRAVLNIPPDAVASVPYPIPEQCRIPEARRRPGSPVVAFLPECATTWLVAFLKGGQKCRNLSSSADPVAPPGNCE
jgi:hypothetical protein